MTYNIPNTGSGKGNDLLNSINQALNNLDDKTTFSSPITSDVTTGTKPLQVASTTKVDNLNADMVGGWKLWKGDQAAYDAIAVKDLNTVYFIGY